MDRNSMDLTEADNIKNRWQEYTENIFMTQITMMVWSPTRARHPGMRNQWALKSITTCKVSGVKEFQSNSQILKDDAMKFVHSICQQIWKAQHWPQNWQRSVFILIPKRGNAKECSNYRTITLNSRASKVMLKILQARLQQYMNRELPDVQAEFRKGRGTRNQMANIRWIIKKAKHLLLLYWVCQSLLTV